MAFNKQIKLLLEDSSDEEEIDCHGWVTTDATDHYTSDLIKETELKNLSWIAEKNATWEEFKRNWEAFHKDNWKDTHNKEQTWPPPEVVKIVEARDAERKRGNTLENDKETSMMNNLHDVLSNCISPVTYMKLEQKLRERPHITIEDYNAVVERAYELETENKQRGQMIQTLVKQTKHLNARS